MGGSEPGLPVPLVQPSGHPLRCVARAETCYMGLSDKLAFVQRVSMASFRTSILSTQPHTSLGGLGHVL